jgi:hypothetical protein
MKTCVCCGFRGWPSYDEIVKLIHQDGSDRWLCRTCFEMPIEDLKPAELTERFSNRALKRLGA